MPAKYSQCSRCCHTRVLCNRSRKLLSWAALKALDARLLQHSLACSWRSLFTCDDVTAAVALTLYWSARCTSSSCLALIARILFCSRLSRERVSLSLFLCASHCWLSLLPTAGSCSSPFSLSVRRSQKSITFYIGAVDMIRPQLRFGLPSPRWALSHFCASSASFTSEHCNLQKSPAK